MNIFLLFICATLYDSFVKIIPFLNDLLTISFSTEMFFTRFLIGFLGIFTFSVIGMLISVVPSLKFKNAPIIIGVGVGFSLFELGNSSERGLKYSKVCGNMLSQ